MPKISMTTMERSALNIWRMKCADQYEPQKSERERPDRSIMSLTRDIRSLTISSV